jgi:hypothetical protein
MARDVVLSLKKWALIADAFASLDCPLEQRSIYIEALKNMVEDWQEAPRPVWQETLITLLERAKQSRQNYSQTEMRCLLRIFVLLCRHVADNYDKWWLAWAKEQEQSKPRPQDAFWDYFEQANDDTQS